MRQRGLTLCALIVAVAMLVGLTGCIEGLFAPDAASARLLMTAPRQQSDGRWAVTLSVADMPEGVSGILIRDGGLLAEGIILSSVEATGMSGFTVTAQHFDDAPATGTLIAVCAGEGVCDGKILRLTFHVNTGDPTLAIDEGRIELAGSQNQHLDPW